MASERDSQGHLQAHPERFAKGMKEVGDFIHSKNLKYGIYNSAGTYTCQHLPGGLHHEEIDAQDYASWGIDYLKYDNCYNEGVPASERYGKMSAALKQTGRDILFSICNWGNEDISAWGSKISNSWRTT
jgi:alpha-galactosidase